MKLYKTLPLIIAGALVSAGVTYYLKNEDKVKAEAKNVLGKLKKLGNEIAEEVKKEWEYAKQEAEIVSMKMNEADEEIEKMRLYKTVFNRETAPRSNPKA